MTSTEATAGTLLRALVTAMQRRESFAKALKSFDEQADESWDELAEVLKAAKDRCATFEERAPNLEVLERALRERRLRARGR